jgi:hypothetical protein
MKEWKARIIIGGKGSPVEIRVMAKTQGDAKKIILAQNPPGTRFAMPPTEVR